MGCLADIQIGGCCLRKVIKVFIYINFFIVVIEHILCGHGSKIRICFDVVDHRANQMIKDSSVSIVVV